MARTCSSTEFCLTSNEPWDYSQRCAEFSWPTSARWGSTSRATGTRADRACVSYDRFDMAIDEATQLAFVGVLTD